MTDLAAARGIMRHYTSSPMTTDGVDGHWSGQWMVWDMYAGLPPKPIFVGNMLEAEAVCEAKNRELVERGESAASPMFEPDEPIPPKTATS